MVLMVLLHSPAVGAPIEASWALDDGAAHRWHVATAIDFPGHVFVRTDQNRDVRAHHLGLEAIVDCEVEASRRSASDLLCRIDDAAWTGMTFSSETGRLQEMLEELEAKLTGASVELRLGDDGQVRSVEVELTPVSRFSNRRTRETDAFVRMMVIRALAPLDLRIPEGGFPTTEPWVESTGLAIEMPVMWGSSARGRLLYHASAHDEARVLVETVGDATMVPGGFLMPGTLILDAGIRGFTVFDHGTGRVSEAVWTTRATPTATSGPLARPYRVQNKLRALAPAEVPTLPPTRELEPAGT